MGGSCTTQHTFRLRQLLQFMASRGSLETRRAGRRSIPICGLDIAAAIDCETSVDMWALVTEEQDASSGGTGGVEARTGRWEEAKHG
jgi:hypothetical protein